MKENLYEPNCIRTVSGQYVNLLDPDPDTILIEDIAHGLAHQCRFAGQIRKFFSVAQHSVYVSIGVSEYHPEQALAALLHDASEFILMDVPSPLKQLLPEYKVIENRLMGVIARKFGFEYPLDESVKTIDRFFLENEWKKMHIDQCQSVLLWSPDGAKETFLAMYYHLQGGGSGVEFLKDLRDEH